jgi:serine/threonine protein kinase
MSPEQAKGKTVDRRADVWAFGACLFEALAGARAFRGDDASDLLGAVLIAEPQWERLPPATDPLIRRLLRRCLEKDPAKASCTKVRARPRYRNVRVSRDGSRLAMEHSSTAGARLRVLSLESGVVEPVEAFDSHNNAPIWGPEGACSSRALRRACRTSSCSTSKRTGRRAG